LEAAIL